LKNKRPGPSPLPRLGLLAGAVALACTVGAAGQSKKAYELIYEDVQLLKQQLLKLEDRIGKWAGDIQSLSGQVRDLQSQLKLLQTDQAGLKQGLQNIPSQHQIVLTRLESLSAQLAKLTEEIIAARTAAAPEAETKPRAEDQSRGKDKKPAKPQEPKAGQPGETAGPPPPSNQAPKEIYDMAYADYIKGNYSLAIDGFKIYRDQFPDSPLSDNALYWIGECYFSQRKFEEAIEQFNLLLFDYPQGDKIPAAYLKKGLCFLELGRKEEALSVFKLLITKYPNEEETRLAQQKIKEILGQNEGHQQP